jgi:eukaryotic-like serine/threonine-protein kinase
VRSPDQARKVVRFDTFEVDLRARELRKEGQDTGLPEQSIRILALLVERPGDVVLREEIRKELWPNDTVVEFDHSINAAMKRLRQALGDSFDDPRYIETLARRGYRWMVPVEWVDISPDILQAAPAAVLPPAESAASNLIGKKVSHYRVLEILGGGGMGVVYRAEDLKLGRQVALKFLPEELGNDAKAVERFDREARAASALDHPNICSIYEFGEHQGQPFIVMQLLEGQTLRERIGAESQGKPLPTNELLDLAIQITRGLEAAHQKGIIHRDIKPANIFITNRGEAKILDFGVAKLTQSDGRFDASAHPEWQNHATLPDEAVSSLSSLTLTGTNLGTAGYMSPEQVRGEKVDARSDLFSFGLVLYEMATGQRAFSGDTALGLRENILRQTSTPVRELNPGVPAELEEIIGRAVEKDRAARYQAAAEMRADLSKLVQEKKPRLGTRRLAVATGVIALLIAVFWFNRVRTPSGQSSAGLTLRQLTHSSFENRVLTGAISPDGKYLAYGDAKGIRIQLVATGETRVIPQPEELEGKGVDWEVIGTWFPDSTRFVANAHPAAALRGVFESGGNSPGSSIWVVSVLNGPPHKLRDNAVAYSVSPDGSFIGFGTYKGRLGDREIWLMGPSGEQARKLFETDEDSSIVGLTWSSDGKRVLYVKTDQSGDTLLSRDLQSGPPTAILGPDEMKRVEEFVWLTDGRLLYSVADPESFPSSCNFWEMQLDGHAGTPIGKPRQLTNWTGFCMSSMSVTADGKKLAFLRWAGKETSFLAELAGGGTRILTPRHFPLSESSEGAVGWTPDSTAIFFYSNRSGHGGIYRQALDQDIAEPVLTEGFGRDGRVSPDGKNIVYLGPTTGSAPAAARGPEPVMRVSVTGGPSQQLFTARPWSLMTCAKFPSDLCVIGEPTEDGKQLIVTALDPLKGRGPELFRFALVADDNNWVLDLSPDGTRVAVIRTVAGPIYILSIDGHLLQQFQVKGWNNLQSLIWAADGKGLFVTVGVRNGREILHVDLQGNAHALWEDTGGSAETLACPSPDGRHLAFDGWTTSGNVWMMDNF